MGIFVKQYGIGQRNDSKEGYAVVREFGLMTKLQAEKLAEDMRVQGKDVAVINVNAE